MRLGKSGARLLQTLHDSLGARNIAPSMESGIAGNTVRVGRKAMTRKLKVVVDAAMG